MQILMTKAAAERVRGRVATLAPGSQIVTAVTADDYELAGQPIDKDAIDPEVVWLSLDSYASGTLGALYGRLMKAQAPRWTQIMAAGIDNPIFRSILEKGVRLTKSSAQATPIAEYVVAHALSLQVPIDTQAALQARRDSDQHRARRPGRRGRAERRTGPRSAGPRRAGRPGRRARC